MMPPKVAAMASARAKAASGCQPAQLISTAISTPVKPMTAPTERSMPPERMTKVMPTAVMPRKALSVRKLPRTRVENMDGNCMTANA
ncbi:hypothetical protein D3C87_1678380 [compost metagenome]